MLIDLASSALEETRTLSRGLDLPAIDIGSFSDSLEQIVVRMRSIYGIEIDLKINGLLGNYSQLKLINLYYIILESINNAIRHGKADKILLRYYTRGKKGFFLIESFQEGELNFDNPGMGLRIMKYRAEVAGMEFSISSKEKRVEVVIKLGDIPDDIDNSVLKKTDYKLI
jgi:signal transduction histidine kinase